MIYGKSRHPVEVKRIFVEIWSVRDEIEAVIEDRLKTEGREEIDLELIQQYYGLNIQEIEEIADSAEANQEEKGGGEIQGEELDPEDEEMMAMAAAVAEQKEEGAEEAIDQSETNHQDAETIIKTLPGVSPERIQQLISFKRVKPREDKISKGFALLADINMETMLVFSRDFFTYGQTLFVQFNIPKKFTLGADVLYTRNYSVQSRIISENKAANRLMLKWRYAKTGERSQLRGFLASIMPEIPKAPPKKAKVEDDDDDLDFPL